MITCPGPSLPDERRGSAVALSAYTPRTNGKAERFIQSALWDSAYAPRAEHDQRHSFDLDSGAHGDHAYHHPYIKGIFSSRMEQLKVTSVSNPTRPSDGLPAIQAKIRGKLQAVREASKARHRGTAGLGHWDALAEGGTVPTTRLARGALARTVVGGTRALATSAANVVGGRAFVANKGRATCFGFLGAQDFS